MTPPQKTDSDISRVAVLGEKTSHNEKTIETLCDKFDRHIEKDNERWSKLDELLGRMRGWREWATWATPLVLAAGTTVLTIVFTYVYKGVENRVTMLEQQGRMQHGK